ncbi:putative isomerase YbhE [Phlegmacium glaucopus]|nr:putative isomerase YbhE [Phlegmacium glaucopus]
MIDYILVGSYSNDITTLAFDSITETLQVVSSLTVGHHPSWITSHDAHPSLVWTGLEQSEGKILALSHDKQGNCKVVSETSSAGSDPCFIWAAKHELIIANYSSGTIGILPISSDTPRFITRAESIQLHGSGPDRSRQQSSHPHQAVVHEEYQELLVPDLGSDSVLRLKKNDVGSWQLVGHVGFQPGGGPRHVAFHDGYLFTILELTSKVVRHRFPPLPALPTFVRSMPTMSNPPPAPTDQLAAGILIPPPNSSFPTPYLYLSNRNDPSPEGDIISIFSIQNPDSLELIAEIRTGLKHLRGMRFGGPDDKYLIAGGAFGGGVKVFERIEVGKSLRLIATNDSIEAPTDFLWL